MASRNVVLLDGRGDGDADLAPVFDQLARVLTPKGAAATTFALREMRLAHCLGCFSCWTRQPGRCVAGDDAAGIMRAIVDSDLLVLFTPVTFGGYAPELKRVMDRMVQLVLPLFQFEQGEVHHTPRYARMPRMVIVGAQREANRGEARIFQLLAGRNAINFHPSSYAAEVVSAAEGAEQLRQRFEALSERRDALPFGEAAVAGLLRPVEALTPAAHQSRRALIVVGSPKVGEASTSSVLAACVAGRLEKQGWAAEYLTLRASLNRREGESEMGSAVERAGLVVLIFPLYVDALPYLVTRALTGLAKLAAGSGGAARRLAVVVNSGFPEAFQNTVALAICREFAAQAGFEWAGGLAIGGGGMIGNRPLDEKKRLGPPVGHIVAALELAATVLTEGRAIPEEAQRLAAKTPMPAAVWKRLYAFMGDWGFKRLAARNGISRQQLRVRPYESE